MTEPSPSKPNSISNDNVSENTRPISAVNRDVTESQSVISSKPPLSPIATHRPPLSHFASGACTLPHSPRNTTSFGAVASLAIGSGLSEEELIKLGQNRHPCPPQYRTTPRSSAVAVRGGLLSRTTPRRVHHTAPPGTVYIGRIARCDRLLSPSGSGQCSYNSSLRSSPLHLTRVGGIATEGDRKSSLPSIPADEMEKVVRIGPGNSVSVGGHCYARINWNPQPYKSSSTEASPPAPLYRTEKYLDNVHISSRTSMLSDTENADSAKSGKLRLNQIKYYAIY